MRLGGRVERVGDVLDRIPRRREGAGPLPDPLVSLAVELRDAHEAVEDARQNASFDELNGGLWDRLREDAFFAAHRFAIEVYRREGRDVSEMLAQLQWWRDERDLEAAATHAERVAAVTVDPDVDELLPEPIRREVEQTIDNRRSMRAALGQPTEEHRKWSELLGGWLGGRTL